MFHLSQVYYSSTSVTHSERMSKRTNKPYWAGELKCPTIEITTELHGKFILWLEVYTGITFWEKLSRTHINYYYYCYSS
jgi:hypothetical protein